MFEVQVKGSVEGALAKLKHAYDTFFLGDVARLDLATELGIALEKRIVSVALGTIQ